MLWYLLSHSSTSLGVLHPGRACMYRNNYQILSQGFRRYLSIRETLCHELAHMVFSEHDNRFKTLNSQIRKHVEDKTRSAGRQLWEAAAGWDLDAPSEVQDAMVATATSSGRTLREVKLPPLYSLWAVVHCNAVQSARSHLSYTIWLLQFPGELRAACKYWCKPAEPPPEQHNVFHNHLPIKL